MGVISSVLKTVGIHPILVGGHAVELYTFGYYTTVDVDLVLNGSNLAGEVLVQLGFDPKSADHSHWYYATLDLAIEIPDSVLAGSMDKISEFNVDDEKVDVIGIEDLILDRLRAGVAWNSPSDLDMATYLLNAYLPQGTLDVEYLKEAANGSKADNVYPELVKLLQFVGYEGE